MGGKEDKKGGNGGGSGGDGGGGGGEFVEEDSGTPRADEDGSGMVGGRRGSDETSET